MAYLTADDFRSATEIDATKQLTLTTAEAADAQLTAAIERLSQRIDLYTRDHFDPEVAQTINLDVRGVSRRLLVPKRVRSVTAVKLVDLDGGETAQDATDYRVLSSLDDTGTAMLTQRKYDSLEVVLGQTLSDGYETWPQGAGTVKVTGDFSWAGCPGDIQRALALMVFDHFKPINNNLRRAQRWGNGEMFYVAGETAPTGMPEVDEILNAYRRAEPIGVA